MKIPDIKLAMIPQGDYAAYRREVIFGAYKWDPQVGDHNTVARHAVLISRQTAAQLEADAEALSREVLAMEAALLGQPQLAKAMGFSRKLCRPLARMGGYRPQDHVRLMRFDFHPTDNGWAISEVNSDVPGGLAEAGVLPGKAARFFPGHGPGKNVAAQMVAAFEGKLPPSGRVAFVHATSYADDRQVMQYLADCFTAKGYRTMFAAPDHLCWNDGKAVSILRGEEGPVDAIVRFFPLEWLANLPAKADWQGYFDCQTPSCNHPAAVLTQSKRLPLVWDGLGVDLSAWRALLPETREPRTILAGDADWIYKPAFGRVGEDISVPGAVTPAECRKIERAARRQKNSWVAQRLFHSQPVVDELGRAFHLCVGAFTLDAKAAGFYARISQSARIDERAQDIPVLIQKENTDA